MPLLPERGDGFCPVSVSSAMRTVPALAILLLAACSPSRGPESPDVLEGAGSRSILRADSEAAEAEIRAEVTFLEDAYGYVPDGTHRDLRALR